MCVDMVKFGVILNERMNRDFKEFIERLFY